MYRAITLKVIQEKKDSSSPAELERLLSTTRIDLESTGDGTRVLLDGADVTEAIRKPEVDRLVSHISVIPEVRRRLVAEQRRIAQGKQVVCEGRDIGSVVFPDADVKFFIDAALATRAQRRRRELRQQGVRAGIKSVEENLSERDYIDSSRAHSPLVRVKDAIYLDTTNLTVEEQVMIVVSIVRRRLSAKRGVRNG